MAFVPVAPDGKALAAPLDQVRIPRPLYAAGWGDAVATSGRSILAWSPSDNGSLFLSTNGGAFEVLGEEYSVPFTHLDSNEDWWYYLGKGYLVAGGRSRALRMDLATGHVDRFDAGVNEFNWGATPTTRVFTDMHDGSVWVQPLEGGAAAAPLQVLADLPEPPQAEGGDTQGSWTTDLTWTHSVPFWWDGDHYLSHVYTYSLDGTGAFSFSVSGRVMAVMGNPGGAENRLRYITKDRGVLRDCTRTAGGRPSCVTIPKRAKSDEDVWPVLFGDILGLKYNGEEYIWEKGRLTKVKGPRVEGATFGGPGVDTRPVYSVSRATAMGDVTTLYTVKKDGTLSRIPLTFPATNPVVADIVDLGPRYLVGRDDLDGKLDGAPRRAWVRDVAASGVGEATAVSTNAESILTSGARYVVNGQDGLDYYDAGSKRNHTSRVYHLAGTSGPYALVRPSSRSWDYELRTPDGTAAKGLRNVVGHFGSLVATLDFGRWRVNVKDCAGSGRWSVPIPYGNGELLTADFWGDWLALSFGVRDPDMYSNITEWQTFFVNYRTGAVSEPYSGEINALGDGLALLKNSSNYDYETYDYLTGAWEVIDEPDTWPSLDDANGAAYFTESELVVRTFPYGGGSSPRVLGVLTPASFNSWAADISPWKLELDATKDLPAGTVVITGPAGSDVPLVKFAVPASSDGAVRVAWDGRLPDGSLAPAGSYSWALEGFGDLVAVDGSALAPHPFLVTNDRNPYPQVAPVIDNRSPRTDSVLSADPGPHPADAAIAYQWFRSGQVIPGATEATYTVRVDDVGARLTVRVSFSDAQFYKDSAKTSAATSTVARATLRKGAVTLSDPAPQVDTPVAAQVEGWGPDPVSLTYRWYRVNSKNSVALISGRTKSTYIPTAADKGYRLKVVVTGSKAGYASASVASAVSPVVLAGAYSDVPTPTIAGDPEVGATLTAVPGTYLHEDGQPVVPSFSYQWLRVGDGSAVPIVGATRATYVPVAADVNAKLQVKVTAKRSGYAAQVTLSAPTEPVAA